MKILLLAPVNEYSLKIKNHIGMKNIIIQTDYRVDWLYLKYMQIDFIISYNYPYIISEEIIKNYEKRIINLHISFLPWNKGADPNFWSWFDNTPKGITIHYINKGIDTGNILVNKEIDNWKEEDTLYSTYEKLQRYIVSLFIRNWNTIKMGKVKSRPQMIRMGSFHYKRDRNKYDFLLEKNGWNTPVKYIREYERKMYG